MNKSLKVKVSSIVGFFKMIGFIVLILIISNVVKKNITDAMLNQYINEDKQVAKQVEILMEKNATIEELQAFIENKTKENNYTAYAVLIDKTVTAVAHSDREKIGKNYSDDTAYTVPAAQNGDIMTSRFWADVQKAWTYDVMVPIYVNGELYGSMDIGFYDTTIDGIVAKTRTTSIVVAIVILVLSIALLMSVLSKELNQVTVLAKVCDTMAGGDFSVGLDPKLTKKSDEIGIMAASIENMKTNLTDLIKSTNEDVEKLNQIGTSLSQMIDDTRNEANHIVMLADGAVDSTTRQREISEENSRMIIDFSEEVKEVANSIEEISKESTQTAREAADGTKKLDAVVNQMSNIKDNVSQTFDEIHKLETMSGVIQNIVEVIADIASQTNLLSLNASIEAARAGEQGKGFAVVANEVGSLAIQSSKSAEDIANNIKEIQDCIKQCVSLMEQGMKSVQDGMDVADNTKSSIAVIAEKIDDISQKMAATASTTLNTSSGAGTLQTRIDEIAIIADDVSENTRNVSDAANIQNSKMDEVQESIRELSELSGDLAESLNVFKM